MNKKVMALAVAGALAAPGAALAQASNVQIYGTMYVEYGYVKQNTGPAGTTVNADIMQAPGSEIGFKGEEALGGGTSAWFQCASSATPLGATAITANGGFCGRSSAVGLKGSFGNVFIGNWDMPFKIVGNGQNRIVSDTGLPGAGPMIFGGSASTSGATAPTTWSRRQNSSIHYNSPVMSGFQVLLGMSSPTNASRAETTVSANTTGAKSRVTSAGVQYTNGPLYVSVAYENHANFFPSGATIAGNDNAWVVGGNYTFGPVKVGLIWTKQKYETTLITSADVSAYNLAVDWKIQGPHELLLAYTKAQDTKGSFGTGAVVAMGNRIYNGGAGQTGANMWQAEYQYWFSKRTRGSLGYVRVSNDTNATYALGGAAAVVGGQSQDAGFISMKTTF